MSHLKLAPPDNVLSPRFTRRPKAEAEADGRPPGADDVALAKLAQRFAPGQSVVVADDQGFDRRAPRTASIIASPPGMQALVAVLIIVALLPSLTFGAMFWLGLINVPWLAPMTSEHDESARLPVQTASLAGMPVAAGDRLKQTTEIRAAVLTAPVTLEARAGEAVPFTITLTRSDELPARSIIAISGLPSGTTLSSGRPYGEREWNLRSDEIGGLRLVLPDTVSGETKLRIDLVASNGESIANAETVLKVIADPRAAALRDSEGPPEREAGNFSGGYAYSGSAVQGGTNGATLAILGSSYDPLFAPGIGDHVKLEPLEVQGWSNQVQEVESSGVEAKPKDPEAAQASEASVQSASSSPAEAAADEPDPGLELSEFVNLREGPSSSARVIGVMAKGSKVHPIARKRGWVQVTNAATSEIGWIYARYVTSIGRARYNAKKAVPSRIGPGSDDSLWTRLSQWVMGP